MLPLSPMPEIRNVYSNEQKKSPETPIGITGTVGTACTACTTVTCFTPLLSTSLLLLATFAEAGYLFFTSTISDESLRDPLERYLRVHVTSQVWNQLTQ